MELKLQLIVFVLLIQVSLALWQRMTVKKGQTLNLSCPITNAHKTNVDWKNPQGFLMFFNHNKALKDKRYRINKLSVSEFAISISNVTFKDGGNYTCSQYGDHTTEKQVEVTVLGLPKMTVTRHEGMFVIKCTAEANHHPSQISWKLDHGPEIFANAQIHHEDKKYITTDMLHVQSVENRVTVKCLVRHPALLSHPLMNFVKIGRDTAKFHRTTTTSSPTTQPQVSKGVLGTTTSWFRYGRTTVYLSTRGVNGASSESSTKLSAVPSNHPFSSNEPKTVTASTRFPVDPVTSSNSHLSASGWTSVSETTEEIISSNSTERNRTGFGEQRPTFCPIPGTINDTRMQTEVEGSSSLLVFLVTCLIFGLLVVVIFFAIKLRRAHITWKRENEESDPSEESSKSKSSHEERNSQGQRRRGLFNMAFTKYVVEEPTGITSVINTGAMAASENVYKEQTSQPQTSAKCDIKETEL
ncbi:cytotoxic and regulatory T-cell molecule isoform X3 [Seriola lalandi dorsalis]|uniref:cytotoxic and regulatory T-cell molecule isoform X3 n=1 Tax=Seriola lalandi dorsalis TaxID=1841481 RepID=UPI000C6FBE4D|nr:cytotoxic and regulatory T-cell molecule isoform X3 [Seriola lalandi dorsalis]